MRRNPEKQQYFHMTCLCLVLLVERLIPTGEQMPRCPTGGAKISLLVWHAWTGRDLEFSYRTANGDWKWEMNELLITVADSQGTIQTAIFCPMVDLIKDKRRSL